MTIESVLEGVLLEIGLDVSAPQIASDSYDIRQIRKFINEAGEDVARRAEWSRMYVSWSVPGGVTAVDLPDDFHEMAESGAARVNKAGSHPIRAVISPEQWAFLEGRPSAQPHYHLSGGQVHFSPALPAEGAKIRYVSKNWLEGKSAATQNADVLLIPVRLVVKGAVWRWKRQKGLPFDDIMAEYEADIVAEIKADRGEA